TQKIAWAWFEPQLRPDLQARRSQGGLPLSNTSLSHMSLPPFGHERLKGFEHALFVSACQQQLVSLFSFFREKHRLQSINLVLVPATVLVGLQIDFARANALNQLAHQVHIRRQAKRKQFFKEYRFFRSGRRKQRDRRVMYVLFLA